MFFRFPRDIDKQVKINSRTNLCQPTEVLNTATAGLETTEQILNTNDGIGGIGITEEDDSTVKRLS